MSLIDKIEKLIKREKTTPERKRKEECTKSSSEILSELFGVFNADPPKIEEIAVKKSKKSKKKHKNKKEKKKRSRSSSSSSSADTCHYSHKRKKRKKSKLKKRKDSDRHSVSGSLTPVLIKPDPELKKPESSRIKTENVENKVDKKTNPEIVKTEPKDNKKKVTTIKNEDKIAPSQDVCDTKLIPMPESPQDTNLDSTDLRFKLEIRKLNNSENDKSKGKIHIKNLKFSAVFEETVKQAEEAKKKAEKYEDGEYTDSSNSSTKDDSNSQFPKSSDPGGILKQLMAEEIKLSEDEKSHSKQSKYKRSSHKSSRHDSSRSRKRSSSRSRRSRSRSTSRYHGHRSSAKSYRSRSPHQSTSRSRRRSTSRSYMRARLHSPRHKRRRSRTPTTGVKLADSEKKRLLEVARRNAINMLKNGVVPAGAAALPAHTRNQVMAAIQSGGKSVDELTDFCKYLSKKEALGELSSATSNDEDISENEDTLAFHHPFLVKDKGPIVMNIRGGAPLPIKSSIVPVANKEELRLQFPVSSGSQHRDKASEWVPVSPKKDDMQVVKLPTKSTSASTSKDLEITSEGSKTLLPAMPPPAMPGTPPSPPPYMKPFITGSQSQLTSVVPALPAPGPQAYPPGVDRPKIDFAAIVSEKIAMIRKEQEKNKTSSSPGCNWSTAERPTERSLGQFTGSTGVQILTPKELASGTQAWAKKDQLVRAAPVLGGMGMHLLQKMGWTPGQGLGKEGTGTLQPLLLEVKLDTKGLQAKEESGNRHSKGKQQRFPRRGQAPLVAGGKHPVSLLGEYCSKHKLGPPEYNLCFEHGPDHKKDFLFKVKVASVEYQPAVASANKKQAKADAAQLALQKLGIVT